jgi:hypothetical protein
MIVIINLKMRRILMNTPITVKFESFISFNCIRMGTDPELVLAATSVCSEEQLAAYIFQPSRPPQN